VRPSRSAYLAYNDFLGVVFILIGLAEVPPLNEASVLGDNLFFGCSPGEKSEDFKSLCLVLVPNLRRESCITLLGLFGSDERPLTAFILFDFEVAIMRLD